MKNELRDGSINPTRGSGYFLGVRNFAQKYLYKTKWWNLSKNDVNVFCHGSSANAWFVWYLGSNLIPSFGFISHSSQDTAVKSTSGLIISSNGWSLWYSLNLHYWHKLIIWQIWHLYLISVIGESPQTSQSITSSNKEL